MDTRGIIANKWSSLSEESKYRAIITDRARHATVTAECTDAQDWRDDWRDDGNSFPIYTLSISIDGNVIGEVTGWHHYDGRDYADSADEFSGACRFLRGDQIIQSGDNVGADLALPLTDTDGVALVYDEGQINQALRDAARTADHGREPTMADLSNVDPTGRSTWYRIDGSSVVEVELEEAHAYRCGEIWSVNGWGEDRSSPVYMLEGYRASGQAEWHKSAADAIAAYEAEHDCVLYASARAAKLALIGG